MEFLALEYGECICGGCRTVLNVIVIVVVVEGHVADGGTCPGCSLVRNNHSVLIEIKARDVV